MYSDYLDVSTPLGWSSRRIYCVKYVDDCLSIDRVPFRDGLRLNVNGRNLSLVRAAKTVEFNATQHGMKMNSTKTKLLTISAAKSYKAESPQLSH